jgi:hypothetical protein
MKKSFIILLVALLHFSLASFGQTTPHRHKHRHKLNVVDMSTISGLLSLPDKLFVAKAEVNRRVYLCYYNTCDLVSCTCTPDWYGPVSLALINYAGVIQGDGISLHPHTLKPLALRFSFEKNL